MICFINRETACTLRFPSSAMRYNLSTAFDVESARTRLEALIRRGAIIELREQKKQRTLPQNKYLHVLLGYLAVNLGETLEYVKIYYYKAHVNTDIFVREKEDERVGRVRYLRSTTDVDTEEMSVSIDRLRTWSAQELGIYLPSADEQDFLMQAEIEVERHRRYI